MIGVARCIIKRQGWKRFLVFAARYEERIKRIVHQNTKLKFRLVLVDQIQRPAIGIGKLSGCHQDFLMKLFAALFSRQGNAKIDQLRKVMRIGVYALGYAVRTIFKSSPIRITSTGHRYGS